MNWLTQLDHDLFIFINQRLSHPNLDSFFVFITNMHHIDWVKFALFPLILLLWVFKDRKYAVKVFVAMVLTAALSDAFCYRVLKKNVDRVRPNQNPEVHSVLRVGYGPKSGSMPSNHAATMFALAAVLTFYYPGLFLLFFTFATLVAYSRVYVGVHYPADVIVGALVGLTIAHLLRKWVFSKHSYFYTRNIRAILH